MIQYNVKAPDDAAVYELAASKNGSGPTSRNKRGEIGTEGLNAFYGKVSETYTPKLEWPEAYLIYNEMRRRDPTLRSAINAIMLMAKQADIKAEAASDKPADRQAAETLQMAWEGMSITNDDFIEDAFSFLPFGWVSFAEGYKRHEDGSIGWSGFHYRRQSTLSRWDLDDNTGEMLGWYQMAAPLYNEVRLPVEKLLHFTAQRDGNNPEGMSPFEAVYEPWHFVKNLQIVNGIGWQRTFVGLPVFEYGEGANPSSQDKSDVKKTGEGLTVDEKQFVSVPPGMKFRLESTTNSGASALLETIRDYRITMLQVFLAEFLFLGTGSTGSRAAHTDKTDMFIEAVNGWLDKPIEAINKQAVPRLFGFDSNRVAGMTDLPRLVHTKIHKPKLDMLGQYIQQIAPHIRLGDDDEVWIRSQSGMPETVPDDTTAPATDPDEGNAMPTGNGEEDDAPANLESTAGLNGAQITAVIDVLAQLRDELIPSVVALELILAVGIEQARAERMIQAFESEIAKKTKPLPDEPEMDAEAYSHIISQVLVDLKEKENVD